MMIRTQMSPSAEEHRAAKRQAASLGIALAEPLRRSLRAVLPADESRPWMRLAGLVESGDTRLCWSTGRHPGLTAVPLVVDG